MLLLHTNLIVVGGFQYDLMIIHKWITIY